MNMNQIKRIALNTSTAPAMITLKTAQGAVLVDREAGIVMNVAVITAGQTLPDGMGNPPFTVDATTLQQVADAINRVPGGVVSRMTHPEIEGQDAIGFIVGVVKNARVQGNRVVADVHLTTASHTPRGNMREYLLDIAEKQPHTAGLSLVSTDVQIEGDNLLRVQSVDAVDWVGAPASNPRGLLSAARQPTTGQVAKGKTVMYTAEQIAYLISIGLPEGADDATIADFVSKLTDEQLGQLNAAGDQPVTQSETTPPAQPAAAAAPAAPAPASTAQSAGKPKAATLSEINEIAKTAGLSSDWVVEMSIQGKTLAEATRIALASKNHREMKPVAMSTPHPTVSGGADLNIESINIAFQDALMRRAGGHLVKHNGRRDVALSADGKPQKRTAHERSNQFMGRPLPEMGRQWLMAHGCKSAAAMSRTELVGVLFSPNAQRRLIPSLALAHSLSDFRTLLIDTTARELQAEYRLQEPLWEKWTKKRTVPDFREVKNVELGIPGNLQKMDFGGEYPFTTMIEGTESAQAEKFGLAIRHTREAFINDDLGAFSRTPRDFVRASTRRIDAKTLGKLTGSDVMSDGKTLFHADHNNLLSGTGNVGAPSATLLDKAFQLFKSQTMLGSSGNADEKEYIDYLPKIMMLNPLYAVAGKTIIRSTVLPGANNDQENIWQGAVDQILDHPRIASAAWYLLADPNEMPVVETIFVEGEEAPYVEDQENFSTDTIDMKVRQYVGVGFGNYRGGVKIPTA